MGKLLMCTHVSPFIIWYLRKGKPPTGSYAISRVELWLSGPLTTLPTICSASESPNGHPWAEPASVRDAVRRQQWYLSNQLPRWHILMSPQSYYFSEQIIPATLTRREMFKTIRTRLSWLLLYGARKAGWMIHILPTLTSAMITVSCMFPLGQRQMKKKCTTWM